MIDISHVLVLSQDHFLASRVDAELRSADRRWPALGWLFSRR